MQKCTIEIHHHGQWHTAALFEPAKTVHQQGYRSPGRLSYDVAYTGQYLHSGNSYALSCRYPIGFELHNEQQWPAFLLDILPAGAGRRFWLQRLQQHDGATMWSELEEKIPQLPEVMQRSGVDGELIDQLQGRGFQQSATTCRKHCRDC